MVGQSGRTHMHTARSKCEPVDNNGAHSRLRHRLGCTDTRQFMTDRAGIRDQPFAEDYSIFFMNVLLTNKLLTPIINPGIIPGRL